MHNDLPKNIIEANKIQAGTDFYKNFRAPF